MREGRHEDYVLSEVSGLTSTMNVMNDLVLPMRQPCE